MILRIVARHSTFLVALAVGLGARLAAMAGFRPALWYADSFQHLGVALRLHPYPVRPIGYPAMLAALEPFGSFAWVAAVQHLMGLATAVLLYALMRRWQLPGWLATVGVLPQLLDGNQIYIEHLIQSEALFTFLVASALVAVLWNRIPSRIAAATAAGLLAAASLVRPIGLPVLAATGAYLLFRSVEWRTLAIAATTAAVPLFAYAVWFHAAHGRFALTTSSSLYLYGRVAVFADCKRFDPPDHLAVLCEDLPPERRRAPDLYIWVPSPLDRLPGVDANARLPADRVDPLRADRAGEFARLVLLNQPGDYLRAGLRDFNHTFTWSRKPFPGPGRTRYQFSSNPLAINPRATYVAGGTALSDATSYEQGPANTVVVAPYAQWMISYQKYVSMRGPILALLLIAGLAGAFLSRGSEGGPPRLLWSTSVLLLIVPPFVASFDYRYVLPAVPFAVAAAAWFAHLLATGRRLGATARSGHTD